MAFADSLLSDWRIGGTIPTLWMGSQHRIPAPPWPWTLLAPGRWISAEHGGWNELVWPSSIPCRSVQSPATLRSITAVTSGWRSL